MRPRFMNRGSHVSLLSITHDHHGFNEAPIHESGKLSKISIYVKRLMKLQ